MLKKYQARRFGVSSVLTGSLENLGKRCSHARAATLSMINTKMYYLEHGDDVVKKVFSLDWHFFAPEKSGATDPLQAGGECVCLTLFSARQAALRGWECCRRRQLLQKLSSSF